jgi:hypothetical protein
VPVSTTLAHGGDESIGLGHTGRLVPVTTTPVCAVRLTEPRFCVVVDGDSLRSVTVRPTADVVEVMVEGVTSAEKHLFVPGEQVAADAVPTNAADKTTRIAATSPAMNGDRRSGVGKVCSPLMDISP